MYTGAQTGEGIYADYPVEANGSVYLPRVGAVKVLGLSLQELRDAIRKAASTVYESHAFTVMPFFHVAVTGAVVYPQTIEAFPGFTVFDVIAKAGGMLDKQGKRTIELIRGSQRTVFIIDDEADIGEIARTPVMGGDRVFVPAQKQFNYQRWGFFLSFITLAATVYGTLR